MSADITSCDQEPIHIPGFIQPHGILLALREDDLSIAQASDNTASHLGWPAAELVGKYLGDVVGEELVGQLAEALRGGQVGRTPLHVFSAELGQGADRQLFHALAHRYDGVLILELEHAVSSGAVSSQNLYSLVSSAVSRLERAPDATALCQVAATELKRLAELDKVMVYLFDEEWNGTVVAEDRHESMDSYMGLRFPASDIPRQARALYLSNRLRLISDVHSVPVPVLPVLNPQTGRSLDMSQAPLRSVSPIHIEYLKNMGVGASMSVAIVQDGQLSGLIACHHRTPKYLSFEVRTACEFLGQVLSIQLTARAKAGDREHRLRLAALNVLLLESMATANDISIGLGNRGDELMELTDSQGVAVCTEGHIVLMGQTPREHQVRELVDWIARENQEVVVHDCLSCDYTPAEEFSSVASGVLAIPVSEVHNNFIVWFRPEAVQRVNWAGNPNKPVEPGEPGARLHPRHSFEVWKEEVRSRSLPWRDFEIEAARELRLATVGIVMRQAEQRAQLTTELERSNKELETFSYSVSHDLRAPFRHILGFSNMLEKRMGESLDPTSRRYLSTIIDSANYAGTLVDNLLAFSRMGRAEMRLGLVDMAQLVREVRASLELECAGRSVEWRVGSLPKVSGDLAMMRLVMQNLISNAIKYTRGREPAIIDIQSWQEGRDIIFRVRDNGVGFDMKYVDKLFGIFQRLHRTDEFEGNGIGLANTRRIVSRHGGHTWAQGTLGEGSSFYFSLPQVPLPLQPGESQGEPVMPIINL
jgi:light-regulated signal transduction histidine kinase (bacteriophytochrome)